MMITQNIIRMEKMRTISGRHLIADPLPSGDEVPVVPPELVVLAAEEPVPLPVVAPEPWRPPRAVVVEPEADNERVDDDLLDAAPVSELSE